MTDIKKKPLKQVNTSEISIILFGFFLIFILAVTTYFITQNTQKNNINAIQIVIQKNLKFQNILIQMSNAINHRMLLINDINLSTDPFEIDDYTLEFNALAVKFIKARDQLIELELSQNQLEQIEIIRLTLNEVRGKLDIVINEKVNNNDIIYKGIIIDARQSNKSVIKEINILIQSQITEASNNLELVTQENKNANAIINLINLIALILASIILFYIIKTLVNRRKQLNQAMLKLEFYNKDLEKVITSRTEDLVTLQKEHLRVNAEIEVNRQIQQFISPAVKELKQLKELDIATYIESADEVGGDYIDVLPCQGGQLICIGDVTDHGLRSNIIMLMTQSIIRHQSNLNCSNLADVLSDINISLFQNIKRMKSDRHLSLSLLHLKENKLVITGQHEVIIIIRENGSTELINTDELGFYVGFVDDIKPFANTLEINLEKGDLVLLHTDGITEAANTNEELYGLERLNKVAQIHHKKPSKDIIQLLINDLDKFRGSKPLYDDVALIAFKKT